MVYIYKEGSTEALRTRGGDTMAVPAGVPLRGGRAGLGSGRPPEVLNRKSGPSAGTIRNGGEEADLDEGRSSDGFTTGERGDLRRLKQENRRGMDDPVFTPSVPARASGSVRGASAARCANSGSGAPVGGAEARPRCAGIRRPPLVRTCRPGRHRRRTGPALGRASSPAIPPERLPLPGRLRRRRRLLRPR